MSRRVIIVGETERAGVRGASAAGVLVPPDGYLDKVIKYIPGEINLAWLAFTKLVPSTNTDRTALWIFFIAFVIVTPLWILRTSHVPGKPPAYLQAAISCGAFIVWAIVLGEPITSLFPAGYQAWIGVGLSILYTLVVGLVSPKE